MRQQNEKGVWHSTRENNAIRHSIGSYHYVLYGNSPGLLAPPYEAIFTDGVCETNPGPSGRVALLVGGYPLDLGNVEFFTYLRVSWSIAMVNAAGFGNAIIHGPGGTALAGASLVHCRFGAEAEVGEPR